ncbi:MAG: hypothetical protein ACYDD1_02995 [Caulobacteraceae bacterium]
MTAYPLAKPIAAEQFGIDHPAVVTQPTFWQEHAAEARLAAGVLSVVVFALLLWAAWVRWRSQMRALLRLLARTWGELLAFTAAGLVLWPAVFPPFSMGDEGELSLGRAVAGSSLLLTGASLYAVRRLLRS